MKLMKFVVLFIITRLIQARVASAQEDTLFTCFETNEELKAAVAAYVLDPSNATSEVALQYGWPIGNWCTDRVTDFSYVFHGEINENLQSFNEDVSSWNTSSATTMYRMFFYAKLFNQPLNSWDVSKVQDMHRMFYFAESFSQPLNGWDVSKVQDMFSMFTNADQFNQPLDSWNVSKVQDMSYMFLYADSFNQPLDSWDVSTVQDMSYMFTYADLFNQPLESWDVSKVQDMSEMFSYASSFDQNLCAWGTTISSDVYTARMFLDSGCPKQSDPDLTRLLIIPRRVPSPLCYQCCRTFQLLCRLRFST